MEEYGWGQMWAVELCNEWICASINERFATGDVVVAGKVPVSEFHWFWHACGLRSATSHHYTVVCGPGLPTRRSRAVEDSYNGILFGFVSGLERKGSSSMAQHIVQAWYLMYHNLIRRGLLDLSYAILILKPVDNVLVSNSLN